MNDWTSRDKAVLRLYPKSYRNDRGDEILGTLYEAHPQHHRVGAMDLLYIATHAFRVRVRFLLKGLGGGPLPQPVRLVTWLLDGLAAIFVIGAVFAHHGPKNAGFHWQVLLTGLAFLALSLMLQARRRALYVLVIGVLTIFGCSIVVDSGPDFGAVLSAPFVVFALLLAIGWRRYTATIKPRGLGSKCRVTGPTNQRGAGTPSHATGWARTARTDEIDPDATAGQP
jgi:hypothetical protein